MPYIYREWCIEQQLKKDEEAQNVSDSKIEQKEQTDKVKRNNTRQRSTRKKGE